MNSTPNDPKANAENPRIAEFFATGDPTPADVRKWKEAHEALDRIIDWSPAAEQDAMFTVLKVFAPKGVEGG